MRYAERVLVAQNLRCSHRPPCPGCPRFGQGLLGSPALDALTRFATEASAELELWPSVEASGYRQRARLAVRGRAASPKLGVFQQGSHRIVDIPSCVVHHPLINEAMAACKRAMRDVGAEPYAEVPDRGLVRYLQVVVERATQTAQVVIVANTEERALLEPLFDRFSQLLGARLHSLFVSPHTGRSNAILGPRCDKIAGPDAIRERIGSADVFFPPDAFGQAHLVLYERIVDRIHGFVPDGADVVELYAGTGAIGLSLLPRVSRVRFNEIAPGSLRGLALGIEALPDALRAQVEVHAGAAAEHAHLAGGADVVIVDPPRKGLDSTLLSALAANAPRQLIYLSCGLDSFLSDARSLLRSSGLKLRALIAYDLFPFTGHVEILAHFARGLL